MTISLKNFTVSKILKSKSPRERYFVLAALGMAVIFSLIKFGIEPFLQSQQNIREEIPVKITQLEKYRQFVAGKSQAEKNLKQVQTLSKMSYVNLLPGETPPLAAANLQNILKTLSAKNLISIKSEKVLDTKVMDYFTQIPVQIEFISTITNLTNFLCDIENYDQSLIITDLNIRATSYREPKDVRAAIVVAGIMKGGKSNK